MCSMKTLFNATQSEKITLTQINHEATSVESVAILLSYQSIKFNMFSEKSVEFDLKDLDSSRKFCLGKEQ